MRISDWSSDVCSSDLVAGFCIGEIDRRVRGKVRIEHDVQQPALALGNDRRHAGNRPGERPLRIDIAQPPGTLGHEQASSEERRVGKESVSTCRSRGAPYHEKTNNIKTKKEESQ